MIRRRGKLWRSDEAYFQAYLVLWARRTDTTAHSYTYVAYLEIRRRKCFVNPGQGSSNYGPPIVQELQFPSCLVMSVNVSVLQCLMGCVVLQQLEGRSLRIPGLTYQLVLETAPLPD